MKRGIQELRDVISRIGYNTDIEILFGEVTAPSPDYRIMVYGASPLELEPDFCVVTQRLIESGLNVGDRVVMAETERGQLFVVIDKIGRF